jgi:imidazolonepropionase-like amidohydrolase
MNRSIVYLIFLLFIGSLSVRSQRPAPVAAQRSGILIRNAVVHTGTGIVIETGAVGFVDGKINYVGKDLTDPGLQSVYPRILDAQGRHVYPGFILPNTILGLTEIESVRATLDFTETGDLNPNIRTITSYNTDSKIIPTVRSNGVLLAQVTPRGGLISGISSVVQLDAWNWEDASYLTDDGMHINWPQARYRTGWWAEPGPVEENKRRNEQVDKLRRLLQQAKAYSGSIASDATNLHLAAIKKIFEGRIKLYIHADLAKDIIESWDFFKNLGVKRMAIVGGEESYLITEYLQKENAQIILSRIHSLPPSSDDAVDLPYRLPKILQDAGILYCLDYSGSMEAMGSRNLPFLAGTAVRGGLTKEQALQAITLNTAKILGIESRTGSIEPGKDANLFISEGDALDMTGNRVVFAFIQGREIALNNSQSELYRMYREKYGIRE